MGINDIMLRTIKMIIARKCVAGQQPLQATAMEVYRQTSLPVAEQLTYARELELQGVIVVGNTFNDTYYKLV